MQLSQRLTQSLVLAPQLQQSLALLQAPTLELKALVEQELQQNPVLEEVDAPETDAAEKLAGGEDEPPAATDPAAPSQNIATNWVSCRQICGRCINVPGPAGKVLLTSPPARPR